MPSGWVLTKTLLGILAITYSVSFFLLRAMDNLYLPSSTQPSPYDVPDSVSMPPRPHVRYGTDFSIGGTSIYGYPKRGGIYVLPRALGVEFDFLGLDRFGSLRSAQVELSPDEEEAFCNQMRRLGAKWWESWEDYHEKEGSADCYIKPTDEVIHFGWPSSGDGVWILRLTLQEAALRDNMPSILYNAFTMDERCQMIEKLGGSFYPDPSTCPYLDLAE